MRVLLCLTASLGLVACATQQENPNYQYSSRFDAKSGQMQTQTAAYRIPGRSAGAAPATRELSAPSYSTPQASGDVYSRVDSNCIEVGGCAPVGIVETQAPVVSAPWESPTENQFAGGETTPGFQALEGDLSAGAAPVGRPNVSRQADAQLPAAEPEWEDIPDMRAEDDIPTLTISGPIYQAEEVTGTQSRALMYRVESGDTAYSIAKSYCTEPSAIQTINNLDSRFSLKVGQDIKVPSLCK